MTRDTGSQGSMSGEMHGKTYYRVSGGPMIVTCHSNRFESSTSPAEKPSTGFFARSAGVKSMSGAPCTKATKVVPREPGRLLHTSKLLLQQQDRMVCHVDAIKIQMLKAVYVGHSRGAS